MRSEFFEGMPQPEDLPDIQRRCIRDREIAIELARAGNIDQMRKRGHFWDCPAGEARCPTVSFLYPRKPRETREGNGVWKFHYHEGIDLHGTNRVTEILAVMGGNVEHAVLNEGTGFSGYGRIVHIKGDDGRYYLYGHCSQLLVRANQRVEAGQPIARVGRTLFDRDSSPERIQWEKDDADGKPATAATPPQGRAMGPHLHFEVSASSYPKPPAAERTPEGEGAVHREDPAVVLEELGAWGAAYLRPMYFPNGQIVSPESTAALHRRIEQGAAGGYFPIGRGGTWHGGVHLPVPPNTPILSPLSGAIVALRLDETPRANGIFGSSNFILVRHQLESSLTQQLWGAVPGITVPTGRGQIDPKLTGATGDPALVRPVKLMLSRLTPRGVTRPYYVFDDNVSKRRHDLDDGTMNHWLVLAIVEFRDANDLDSQDLHAVLTHGSVAFLRMQDQFRQLLTAERRARRNDVAQRRQRLVAAARGTGRVVDAPSTVYSLFMNLRAVSLDTVLPRCQWLSVASPPLNAAERHQEGIASNAIRAERAEATRETWWVRLTC